MPGFFDKVKESLDKGVTAASVRSKELLETQQVKSKIGALQDQRRSALEELGKSVFDMMVAGTLDQESLRAKVEAISDLDRQIAEKEEELRQIHLRAEEALAGISSSTATPGSSPSPQSAARSAAEESSATKTCASCGSQISGAAKFCPSCGSKVE